MPVKRPVKRDDWNLQPVPEGIERLDWSRLFSKEEYRLLQLGFKPIPHIDDWFAFFENHTFYVYWQHSGKYVCQFSLDSTDDGYRVTELWINRALLFGNHPLESVNGIVNELLKWIRLTERPARREDWRNLPLPAKSMRLELNAIVTAARYEELQWGFVPRAMEDHWFYFMDENWLFVHRSWTGFCIYQVRFEPAEAAYQPVEVWVNRDPDQHPWNDEQDYQWLRRVLAPESIDPL